jgi:hypothetical protein
MTGSDISTYWRPWWWDLGFELKQIGRLTYGKSVEFNKTKDDKHVSSPWDLEMMPSAWRHISCTCYTWCFCTSIHSSLACGPKNIVGIWWSFCLLLFKNPISNHRMCLFPKSTTREGMFSLLACIPEKPGATPMRLSRCLQTQDNSLRCLSCLPLFPKSISGWVPVYVCFQQEHYRTRRDYIMCLCPKSDWKEWMSLPVGALKSHLRHSMGVSRCL